MRKIKLFLLAALCFCTLNVQAAYTSPAWEQMQIQSVYQRSTQEMKLSFLLDDVSRISNTSYIMTLNIAGKLFQQTLQYDDVDDTLSANFVNFTKKLESNYPLSYTIKSSRSTTQILYTYTGTLVFRGNVATLGTVSTQTGSTQTGSSNVISKNAKDADTIYTLVMQNIPKSLTTTQAKIRYLDEVISSLRGYALRYPSRKTVLDMAIVKFETQIAAYKNPSIKRSYIPKYKSRAQEPSVINGIGNSKTKNSWRVD